MEKYIKYQGGLPEETKPEPAPKKVIPASQQLQNAVKAVSDSGYNDRDDLEDSDETDSNDDDDLTPMREEDMSLIIKQELKA
jgi:hypothetical protein